MPVFAATYRFDQGHTEVRFCWSHAGLSIQTAEFTVAEGVLEVATHREITFVSTGVEVTGEKTANVTGDLTIHGAAQPVTLETTLTHVGERAAWHVKGQRSAQGQIGQSESI